MFFFIRMNFSFMTRIPPPYHVIFSLFTAYAYKSAQLLSIHSPLNIRILTCGTNIRKNKFVI